MARKKTKAKKTAKTARRTGRGSAAARSEPETASPAKGFTPEPPAQPEPTDGLEAAASVAAAAPQTGDQGVLEPAPRKSIPVLEATFFRESDDALYVLDADSEEFLSVNPSFASLTGYSAGELIEEGVSPRDLVYGRSGKNVVGNRQSLCPLEREVGDRFEVTLVCKDGQLKEVEAIARTIRIDSDDSPLIFGSLRDISARKRIERRLKQEAERERTKKIDAKKVNVRFAHLNRKIRAIPVLQGALQEARDFEDLFSRAGELLGSGQFFHYLEVALLVVEEGDLVLRHASRDWPLKRFSLEKNHRLAQVARNREVSYQDSNGELVVPIFYGDELLGLLQVVFDEEERFLIQDDPELLEVHQQLAQAVARSLASALEHRRLQQSLKAQEIRDGLTGTCNRKHFTEKLGSEIKRSLRYNRDISLIMVGVDGFREINETRGHDDGDRLLQELAERLVHQFREIDTVCRYGSDEFAVLLPETSLTEAMNKAENLRKAIAKKPFLSERGKSALHVTVSVGVTSRSEGIIDLEQMIKHTEEALYEAKTRGRNLVCFYSDRIHQMPRKIATRLE